MCMQMYRSTACTWAAQQPKSRHAWPREICLNNHRCRILLIGAYNYVLVLELSDTNGDRMSPILFRSHELTHGIVNLNN